MRRRLKEPEHEKPKKPKYVPPRKPFKAPRSAHVLPLAASTVLAVLSMPGEAKAGIVVPAGPRLPEAAKSLRTDRRGIEINYNPTIEGGYSFEHGKAKIEFMQSNLETLDATYRITFDVGGERYSPVMRFNAPSLGALGPAIGVFASETRTVILTYNYLLVTQGYHDLLSNPGTLRMNDGERLDENSFSVRLPEGARGGNLYHPQAVDGPNGELSVLFAVGNNCIWSFRTDVPDGSPVSKVMQFAGRVSLHAYEDYVLLFQPDSEQNFVSIFRRNAQTDEVMQVAAFSASGEVAPTNTPSATPVPKGYIFSNGERSAIITFDDETSAFTAASTPNR